MSEQHRMKGQSLSKLGSGLTHLKLFLFLMTEGILIPIQLHASYTLAMCVSRSLLHNVCNGNYSTADVNPLKYLVLAGPPALHGNKINT